MKKARVLLSQSANEDVLAFESEANFIFKYRISTNDFVIGRPDGKISTIFKPDDGMEYWKEQVELFKKKEG
ncbi:MAG: hypothetical protein GX666_07130 [Tissierellia bacterium]|nr:hypothetical protein [Tissierellia bacterium]